MPTRTHAPRPRSRRLSPTHGIAAAGAVALALSALAATATAQTRDRSGAEVVNAVCAACHTNGENGAPRVGDTKAWATRASQGLTTLTQHAIQGIRNMPAHGGNVGVSDIEIERAITVMVNRSGGHWVEPLRQAGPGAMRSGEQVVQMQCASCHQAGLNGAPKIGDRAAWSPRMKNGLDPLVASAVHGHGAMPARGGMADLSDPEIRGAIVYMFNVGVPAAPPAAAAAPSPGANHKVVGNTEIDFGLMRAESIRAAGRAGQPANGMHGGVPSGKDQYHLNITLTDSQTRAAIRDAQVKVRVADVGGMGVQTKTLEAMTENNALSYGNYFRMPGGTSYVITTEVRRAGTPSVIEAKFDFKAP